MMGYKIRNLKTFTSFSLETLVPEDNFYRQVEKCVDLGFVRDLVRPCIQLSDAHLLIQWFSSSFN